MNDWPRLDMEFEPYWRLGGSMLLIYTQPRKWVHRRVESAVFIDAASMRRRISVDFEIPGEQLSPGEPPDVVPLALLEKTPMVDLDVRAGDGSPIPVLTKQENGFVAWSALSRMARFEAEQAFGQGKQLAPGILEDLKTVAGGSPAEALEVLDRFTLGADTPLRAVLNESPFFSSLASELAQNFLLLIPVGGRRGSRRIVKFSYAQRLEFPSDTARERFIGQMGWRATEYGIDLPAVGEAESYHFEFESPPGLDVAACELVTLETDDEEGQGEVDYHAGKVVGPFAHVYVSGRRREEYGYMKIWLRPPRVGLLRSGLISSALTAVVMVFFAIGDRINGVEGNAPAALLLTIPGLIAAFIVRPGEHGMATNLLTGIRGATAVSGMVAYFGAIMLIGGIAGTALVWSWRVLAIVACLCWISLIASRFGRKPSGLLSEEGASG